MPRKSRAKSSQPETPATNHTPVAEILEALRHGDIRQFCRYLGQIGCSLA